MQVARRRSISSRTVPRSAGGLGKEKLVGADLQRLGQGDQDGEAELGVAGLDVAHVGGGDTDKLRQLLLRQAVSLARFPNSLPDCIVVHSNPAHIEKIYLNCIGIYVRI